MCTSTDDSMFINWEETNNFPNDIGYYVKLHSDVAYRIYLGSHLEQPCVVCVQEFDLRDYEDAWFKTKENEIVELSVAVYHYFHQESQYVDDETKELVVKYMNEHWEEVMEQYHQNKKGEIN